MSTYIRSYIYLRTFSSYRQMLATTVLMSGGSSMFEGMAETFSDKLIQYLPKKHKDVSAVNCFANPKGVDPRFLAWKGTYKKTQSEEACVCRCTCICLCTSHIFVCMQEPLS